MHADLRAQYSDFCIVPYLHLQKENDAASSPAATMCIINNANKALYFYGFQGMP